MTSLRAMTSTKRVLTIPELLEFILECADVKDIFFWQRVDRGWQSIIHNSHRIQDKILFRSPVHETKPSTERGYTDAVIGSEWNPIILQLGRRHAEDFFGDIDMWRISEGWEWDIYEPDTNTLQDLDFGYAEASWKQIFAIKPAPREVMITWLDSDLRLVVQGRLRREGGITLGDLSQAYQEVVLPVLIQPPAVEGAHDGSLRIAFSVESVLPFHTLDTSLLARARADSLSAKGKTDDTLWQASLHTSSTPNDTKSAQLSPLSRHGLLRGTESRFLIPDNGKPLQRELEILFCSVSNRIL